MKLSEDDEFQDFLDEFSGENAIFDFDGLVEQEHIAHRFPLLVPREETFFYLGTVRV